jgi:hypothetical protein
MLLLYDLEREFHGRDWWEDEQLSYQTLMLAIESMSK